MYRSILHLLPRKLVWNLFSWGICAFFIFFLIEFQAADDPYITYRYARNLNQGYGLVYNPGGEHVEGYTNFLWVLISAAAMQAGWHPLIATKIIGVILAFATLAMAQRITASLLSPARNWNSLSLAIIGGTIPFAIWVSSGMETALTVFLITMAVYLRVRLRGDRLALGYGVISVFLLLDRPDGVVAIVAFLADILMTWMQENRGDFRKLLRQLSWMIAPLILVIAPYYIWRLSYFGYFFPNTFYAKGAGLPLSFKIGRGIVYSLEFISSWAMVTTLLAILYIFRGVSLAVPRLCYMLVILHLAYILFVGGDVLPDSRFFVPIIPILSILAVLATDYLISQFNPKEMVAKGLPIMVIAVHLAGSLYAFNALRIRQQGSLSIPQKVSSLSEPICPFCNWLKSYAPADSSVALFAAGYIPYYTNFQTIDRIGLNDTYIAHNGIPVLTSGGVESKITISYWLPKQPTFIFTFLKNSDLLNGRISSIYTEDELLFNEAAFVNNYVLLILQPEDSPNTRPYSEGIFQRKDTVNTGCLRSVAHLPVPYCMVNVGH